MTALSVLLAAPVAPDAIAHPTDRFRCDRQSAVITAAECQKRHIAAHVDVGGKGNRKKMIARIAAISASACKGCELGPKIIHPRLT